MNLFKQQKTDKQIIQEIHDSFDNAQEELLVAAKKIMSEHIPSEKAERLRAIGFTGSTVVKEYDKRHKNYVVGKEDANLVAHYKQNYPFLKFLKEEQLDEICDKYNLVYASIDRYLKDVPEKNLSDIEGVQRVKGEDKGEDLIKILRFSTPNMSRKEVKNLKKINQSLIFPMSFIKDLGKSFQTIKGIYFDKSEIIHKKGLFIAAPQSHFNLEGLKKNKKGFFSTTVREVKDPIVFRYVKGGIQVITKWGLEAEDELLQNEKLN